VARSGLAAGGGGAGAPARWPAAASLVPQSALTYNKKCGGGKHDRRRWHFAFPHGKHFCENVCYRCK